MKKGGKRARLPTGEPSSRGKHRPAGLRQPSENAVLDPRHRWYGDPRPETTLPTLLRERFLRIDVTTELVDRKTSGIPNHRGTGSRAADKSSPDLTDRSGERNGPRCVPVRDGRVSPKLNLPSETVILSQWEFHFFCRV